MYRIALVGGPGCGKSTQASHFFSILKSNGYKIDQIQEWCREAINDGKLPYTPWAQFWIYEEQLKKETCIPDEIDYMVTDSPVFLSYIYAVINSTIEEDNWLLVKMYEKFLSGIKRYDSIFICKRENKYVLDGTRRQSEEHAIEIDNMIINMLDYHKVQYTVLSGTVQERTEIMCKEIGIDLNG